MSTPLGRGAVGGEARVDIAPRANLGGLPPALVRQAASDVAHGRNVVQNHGEHRTESGASVRERTVEVRSSRGRTHLVRLVLETPASGGPAVVVSASAGGAPAASGRAGRGMAANPTTSARGRGPIELVPEADLGGLNRRVVRQAVREYSLRGELNTVRERVDPQTGVRTSARTVEVRSGSSTQRVVLVVESTPSGESRVVAAQRPGRRRAGLNTDRRAQIAALAQLGVTRADRRRFFSGDPVYGSLPTGGGPDMTITLRLSGSRLVAGIFSVRDESGSGARAFAEFRGAARVLARALGASELEIQGQSISNSRIDAMLRRQGFTEVTVELPARYGRDETVPSLSRVFPVTYDD